MSLRVTFLACSLALAFASGCDAPSLFGENPPPAPFGPHPKRVQDLLIQRHRQFANVTSVYAEFKITDHDVIWQTPITPSGSFRYVHPNQGRLDIITGDDPESYVFTDQGEVWRYRVPFRNISVYHPESLAKPLCDWGFVPLPIQWALPVTPALLTHGRNWR